MERDAHYFTVGLFVIIMAVVGFLFAGLFYPKTETLTAAYDVKFDSSVEGLQLGNEVHFMGLKVGQVKQLTLLDKPVRVIVRVHVQPGLPINTATYATLEQQGLTGVSFVNLIQDNTLLAKPFTIPVGTDVPLIPARVTGMDAILAQLPDLQQKLTQLLETSNQVLGAENQAHFASLLKNLDKTSAELPKLINSVQQTSQRVQTLSSNLDKILGRTDKQVAVNLQQLKATLGSLQQTSQHVDQLAQDIDRLVVSNEARTQDLLSQGGEGFKQLLDESRQTAIAIRRLSDRLEQNPSQLLYQPPTRGTELPP